MQDEYCETLLTIGTYVVDLLLLLGHLQYFILVDFIQRLMRFDYWNSYLEGLRDNQLHPCHYSWSSHVFPDKRPLRTLRH
jgi:hypothetical protein